MVKDLKYWKNNCEEDYLHTPISVLRYISELEKSFTENKINIDSKKELLESVDIEKLAEDFAKNHSIYPTAQDDTEYGFKHGFQKAIELLKQQEQC